MNTSNTTLSAPGLQPGLGERIRHSKALIPTLAVLAVTVAALGATLAVKQSDAQIGGPATPAAQQAMVQPAVTPPARQPSVRAPAVKPPARPAAAQEPGRGLVASRAPVACTQCGVVESVVAVQRQQPVQGIGGTQITPGAVAGGVIGGLLGNQIGHGNGRAAATVLGAAGGAYAGNAIQKNMNTYTAYQVHVRMNDGSVRTIEQRAAVAVGAPVVVEGQSLRPQPAATPAQG